MRSLREVKTQIYQTECGKYLKEGLCLSEPILTLGKEGLIDNFFQYAAEEKGMYFGRPNLLFGIYSDSVQNGISDGRDQAGGQSIFFTVGIRKGKNCSGI